MATSLEIIAETSLLIMVILAVRKLFWRKCNPNIRYFLWIFVAVRILLPFHFVWEVPDNSFTRILLEQNTELQKNLNSATSIISEEGTENTVIGNQSIFADTNADSKTNADKADSESVDGADLQKMASANLWQNPVFWSQLETVLMGIWVSGSVLLACYFIGVNRYTLAKVKKRKLDKLSSEIDVYEVEEINGLVGILHPKIYMSKEVLQDETCRRYVFLHEMQHYKVKDNLWLFLRTLCVVIQWFNPLVWVAYFKTQEDCELACDYRVLCSMADEEKEKYAETLLHILRSNLGQNRAMVTAMGNDKNRMKRRLEHIFILHNRRPVPEAIAFTMVLLLAWCSFVSCTVRADEKVKTAQTELAEQSREELEFEEGIDKTLEQKKPENTERIDNMENAESTESTGSIPSMESTGNVDGDGDTVSIGSGENTAQQVEIIGPPMEGDDWLKIIGEVEETEDRRIVYEIAKEVTAAYFQGDLETIKKYLVEDYEWTMNTYLDFLVGHDYTVEDATIYGIKGLSNVGDAMGKSYTVEVEFLPVEDDSLFYFFMIFEKQENGWRIRCYGVDK